MNDIEQVEKQLLASHFRTPQQYAIAMHSIFEKGYRDPSMKISFENFANLNEFQKKFESVLDEVNFNEQKRV